MKFRVYIDPEAEEEVIVRAHEQAPWIEELEATVLRRATEVIGYREGCVARLTAAEILFFSVEDGKTYAVTADGRYRVRERLYTLEEKMGAAFVPINQSCLARIDAIAQFEVSVGGSLMVVFRNGARDYVARRRLKQVKERMGLRK